MPLSSLRPKYSDSAAVRAELVDQADLALGVAERQQLLAENLHAHLRAVRLGDLPRQQDRHPVAASVAHRGAGSCAHQRFRHFLVHSCTPWVVSLERAVHHSAIAPWYARIIPRSASLTAWPGVLQMT